MSASINDAPRALVFDKDGTLFDFEATWSVWAGRAIRDLARGDERLAEEIAATLRFDLKANRFAADSPVIGGTVLEQAERLLPFYPDVGVSALTSMLIESSLDVPQVPVTDLGRLMKRLRAAGIALGIATNDSEAAATRHLEQAGLAGAFDFVAGYDSGFGGKPAPGQLLAFADAVGVAPSQSAMIGDSTHDLFAGRAAGMTCIGVLTGPAQAADLAPHADVVLEDISHLPAWMGLEP